MRIFEHRLDNTFSTNKVTSETTFNSIRQAVSSMRDGIGYSSKILVCHTSMVDKLRKLINENLLPKHNPDLHIIKPYRVIGNPYVPICYEIETNSFLECIVSSMRLRQFKKIEKYILTHLS